METIPEVLMYRKEFPIHEALRGDAQLAEKKFMLRIPLARKEPASDSLIHAKKGDME